MSPDFATARTEFRFGWWTIALFTVLGVGLEVMHGFKVGAYLDVGNETRRLMWTLAHAHGTLLGLLHIGWAATMRAIEDGDAGKQARTTGMLRAASVLLPGGFFLGGVWTYGSDPGLAAVIMVPLGALALIGGLVSAARQV